MTQIPASANGMVARQLQPLVSLHGFMSHWPKSRSCTRVTDDLDVHDLHVGGSYKTGPREGENLFSYYGVHTRLVQGKETPQYGFRITNEPAASYHTAPREVDGLRWGSSYKSKYVCVCVCVCACVGLRFFV